MLSTSELDWVMEVEMLKVTIISELVFIELESDKKTNNSIKVYKYGNIKGFISFVNT